MSRREFPQKVRVEAFQRAKGQCEECTARLGPGNVHYDHIVPDWLGGEPILSNCAVLCRACHGVKTATKDVPAIARTKRVGAKHIGARPKSRNPLPGGKSDPRKRKISGGWEWRDE